MGIIPNDATYFHQPPSFMTGRTYLCYLWTNAQLHNTGAVWRSANLSGSGSFLEGLWEVQGAPLLVFQGKKTLGRFFSMGYSILASYWWKILAGSVSYQIFFSKMDHGIQPRPFLQLPKPHLYPPASVLFSSTGQCLLYGAHGDSFSDEVWRWTRDP